MDAVRVTYDQEADAAYINMKDFTRVGSVAHTEVLEGRADGIHLDFDKAGCLIGIEVLDAKTRLDADVLRVAAPPEELSLTEMKA